jgi:hypothetical protein
MRSLRNPVSNHIFNSTNIPFYTYKSSPVPLQALASSSTPTNPSPTQAPLEFRNIVPINAHIQYSPKQANPASKSTLLDPIPPTLSQTRSFSYLSSDPCPNYHVNGDANSTILSNSSKQQKPIFRTRIYDANSYRFTQTRPFSTEKSDPCSKSLDFTDPRPSSSNAIPVVSTIRTPFEASQPIDAGSSIRKPISLWPGMYHSPVTNALWEARSSIFEKVSDTPTDAPSQGELVKKNPGQSRTSIVYKFSSDYILREQYRNPWNEIRMGKLVEDLDALAGTIAFKVILKLF